MSKGKSNEQVEQAIQAVGAMAEMGLTFYRAAVGVGGGRFGGNQTDTGVFCGNAVWKSAAETAGE